MVLLKVETEFPDERIADIIVGAVEGGIGYWARTMAYEWDCAPRDTYAIVVDFEEAIENLGLDTPAISEQLFGASYYEAVDSLYDDNPDALEKYTYKVNFFDMARVFQECLAGKHGKNGTFYANQMLTDDDDATTYDVLFQIATLGKLVYA
jgi:hypothetical protein